MKEIIAVVPMVGEPVLVRVSDGDKVYRRAVECFHAGKDVVLDFTGYRLIYTPFLNAAVGQLFNGEFDQAFILEHLSFLGLNEFYQGKVNRVMGNAPRYYKNADVYNAILDREVGA